MLSILFRPSLVTHCYTVEEDEYISSKRRKGVKKITRQLKKKEKEIEYIVDPFSAELGVDRLHNPNQETNKAINEIPIRNNEAISMMMELCGRNKKPQQAIEPFFPFSTLVFFKILLLIFSIVFESISPCPLFVLVNYGAQHKHPTRLFFFFFLVLFHIVFFLFLCVCVFFFVGFHPTTTSARLRTLPAAPFYLPTSTHTYTFSNFVSLSLIHI